MGSPCGQYYKLYKPIPKISFKKTIPQENLDEILFIHADRNIQSDKMLVYQ